MSEKRKKAAQQEFGNDWRVEWKNWLNSRDVP